MAGPAVRDFELDDSNFFRATACVDEVTIVRIREILLIAEST